MWNQNVFTICNTCSKVIALIIDFKYSVLLLDEVKKNNLTSSAALNEKIDDKKEKRVRTKVTYNEIKLKKRFLKTIYTCKECENRYENKVSLTDHQRIFHGLNISTLFCAICNEQFADRKQIRQHTLKHIKMVSL